MRRLPALVKNRRHRLSDESSSVINERYCTTRYPLVLSQTACRAENQRQLGLGWFTPSRNPFLCLFWNSAFPARVRPLVGPHEQAVENIHLSDELHPIQAFHIVGKRRQILFGTHFHKTARYFLGTKVLLPYLMLRILFVAPGRPRFLCLIRPDRTTPFAEYPSFGIERESRSESECKRRNLSD